MNGLKMTEWLKLVWELEEIDRRLKNEDAPLTPKEKDALHVRIMLIHRKMNQYIQDQIVKGRSAAKP